MKVITDAAWLLWLVLVFPAILLGEILLWIFGKIALAAIYSGGRTSPDEQKARSPLQVRRSAQSFTGSSVK